MPILPKNSIPLCIKQKHHKMKLKLLLLILILVHGGKGDLDSFAGYMFLTPLDHFDTFNTNQATLPYLQNSVYEAGGPIFIKLMGPKDTREPSPQDQLMSSLNYHMAKKMNGTAIFLWQRSAIEVKHNSTFRQYKDFEYLTVDQNLEDIAAFIIHYKNKKPDERYSKKVVVFGCGYEGTLAVWARYKYPHLIDAAWANDAYIRIAQEYSEYFEILSEYFLKVDSDCYKSLNNTYNELGSLPPGHIVLDIPLGKWICTVQGDMDLSTILLYIRNIFVNSNFDLKFGSLCGEKFMKGCNTTNDCFLALMNFVKENSAYACPELQRMDKNDLNEVFVTTHYRQCTEFPNVPSNPKNGSLFHNSKFYSTKEHHANCTKFIEKWKSENSTLNFGKLRNSIIDENVKRLNRVFGSTNINVTKVFFLYNTYNPWYKLGYLENKSDAVAVKKIAAVPCWFSPKPEKKILEILDLGMPYITKWLEED